MKILAIEKELNGVKWDNMGGVLEQEAQQVFQLYLSDSLKEIYFTDDKNAVLILEAESKKTAEKMLDSLPLVKEGMIMFNILELRPYTGYKRLLKDNYG